jgi:hypothetical protein
MTKITGYLFLVILFFIIGYSGHDMWDGVIASYGFEVNDISGSRASMLAHGWYLQHFLHLILFELASNLQITFFQISSATSLVLIGLMAREVMLLSKKIFFLEDFFAKIAFCLFIIFPVWQIFFSSIHIIFIFCILLGVVGTRYIHTEHLLLKQCIGYLFIILSFQLSSMLVFIPILSYVYESNKRYINQISLPSKLTWFIFSLSVIVFALRQIIFPSVNEISGSYNQLINPFSSLESFKLVISGLLSYSTFLILLLPLSFLFLTNMFLIKSYLKELYKKLYDNWPTFFLLVILLGGSVFTYIMVGKASMLTTQYVMQWEMRHSILLAPVAAIFIAWLFQMISLDSPRSLRSNIFIILTMLISVTFLFIGVASKLNRHEFETQLFSLLESQEISPGTVYFVLDSTSENLTPIMRPYELNYLFYRVYKNINYNVSFVSKDSKALEQKGHAKEERDQLSLVQSQSKDEWLMEIYDPSNTKCKSIISMEINDFSGNLNVIKNSLGLGNGKLTFALDSTQCFEQKTKL